MAMARGADGRKQRSGNSEFSEVPQFGFRTCVFSIIITLDLTKGRALVKDFYDSTRTRAAEFSAHVKNFGFFKRPTAIVLRYARLLFAFALVTAIVSTFGGLGFGHLATGPHESDKYVHINFIVCGFLTPSRDALTDCGDFVFENRNEILEIIVKTSSVAPGVSRSSESYSSAIVVTDVRSDDVFDSIRSDKGPENNGDRFSLLLVGFNLSLNLLLTTVVFSERRERHKSGIRRALPRRRALLTSSGWSRSKSATVRGRIIGHELISSSFFSLMSSKKSLSSILTALWPATDATEPDACHTTPVHATPTPALTAPIFSTPESGSDSDSADDVVQATQPKPSLRRRSHVSPRARQPHPSVKKSLPASPQASTSTEGSFPSRFRLRSPILKPPPLPRRSEETRSIVMQEPGLEAGKDEVRAAYEAAFAEVKRLEGVVDSCSSPEWKKNSSALARAEALAQRLITRLSTLATADSIGEIEKKVQGINERQGALSTAVSDAKTAADEALAISKRTAADNVEVRADIDFLSAGYLGLRKLVEKIDHRQRSYSVIVYGIPRGDPYQALEKLFQQKPALWRNLDEAYFLGKKPGRRPLLATFGLISACNECLAYSHTDAFTKKFPEVTVVRDRSDYWRTGISRLSTAAQALTLRFPNAKVHNRHDFVEIGGNRIDAVEFAASTVEINGVVFDIDDACGKNVEYELNLALFVRIGDVIIYGYKKIGTQYTGTDGEEEEEGAEVEARGVDVGNGRRSVDERRGNAQKRTLSGFDGLSSGRVRLYDGTGLHQGQSRNLASMGSLDDPYDVRVLSDF